MRKTKIICTLGPNSRSEEVIEEMIQNGMNVARLNFSHQTHETHKQTIDNFKSVRKKLKVSAALMLDTKGPEIRIGTFKDDFAELKHGEEFILTARDIKGDSKKVSITYKELPKKMSPDNIILINDGLIRLRVKQIIADDIICTVDVGGKLTNRKGINIPGIQLDMPFISKSDEEDLLFGIEEDVDFVAASFVRNGNDVKELRNFLDFHGGRKIKIISKIENTEGVNNFDDILERSDGIMIARGDMGVEIPYEHLPGLQKKLIDKCVQHGKTVITATQMLESMIHNNTPTRAEITDIANAVFDGTSAIMLSGETAIGDHPALVVSVMSKIAEQAEKDAFEMEIYKNFKFDTDEDDITNAICDAACTTARDIGANAIIAVTNSGHTARRVAKFRPKVNIIGTTPNEKTFNQLSIVWGVFPIKSIYQENLHETYAHAIACAKLFEKVSDGDRVIITSGTNGTTDLLKVKTITSQKE
ncbi:MAG: pyruvate kinase [Clostridia bacterium]|nr:pyruvate kinase [Clostridia bacterium]